jgi:hypothetical protein
MVKTRKMTTDEAAALGLEPYVDYYEFGGDGTCVSLRDGKKIGGSHGNVSLSGKIRTTNVRLIKIVACMYMGVRDFKENHVYAIDGDNANSRVDNIGVMTKKERNEKLSAEYEPRQRFGKEKRRANYVYGKTFRQSVMSEWYRNNI